MGYIIKPIGKVAIRIDNYQILSKTRQLETDKSLVQKRDGFDIIVYPEIEGEFDYFYAKHVLHEIGEKTFSVLVVDEEYPFNKKTARLMLRQIILDAKEIEENKVNYYTIPQIMKGHTTTARNWNSEAKQFVDKPKNCCFILRDVKEVSSFKGLSSLNQYITQNELNTVLNFINKAKSPEETYIIRKVLFIGKYFVAA